MGLPWDEGHLVDQWYPLPFFGVQGSLTSRQTPKKGRPFHDLVAGLLFA